jgi:formylglycine-generating enzyme required for sulfatase activity
MKTIELPGGIPLEFCDIPGKQYLLGKYPVTQEQYLAIAGVNPSYFKGDKLPVEKVSWDEATQWCQKLSEQSGQSVRLPTESEWEYACRAGTTTEYNTGDGEKALAKAGWYFGNSDGKTHPVGLKEPNAWGLHDMHGNVWEWCQDEVGDRLRVLRGGSWDFSARWCRSAYRSRWRPDVRGWDAGFRVCLAASVSR